MPLHAAGIHVIVAHVDARELISRGLPVIRASVELFGTRAAAQIGEDPFSMDTARVRSFLRDWGGDRITGKVNEYTRSRIGKVLEAGVARGDTTTQLADAVRGVFKVATESRSITIAQNEVARASNFASVEGYRQVGIKQKAWQATDDDKVRDSHLEMDGQVVDIDEEFTSGDGNHAPYPCEFGIAEEDINCRCGVLAEAKGRRSLRVAWKFLNAARAPFARKCRAAMVAGFLAQQREVFAIWDHLVKEAAA